ncbi:hypothetical protein [Fibrobacter sp.]|uniref:hypothetical protein n=1 Tax=Fibrobacter sp. TaxID=35828 RepID=UPI00260EEE30|nr:hypothetical protein [Fibrobacter sp.]
MRYSCVSPAEKRRIYKEVQASVGTLFLAKPEGNLETPDDESIRELVPADLTDSFYANLQALIGRFTENGDYYAMLGLLQILDQSMALLLNKAIGEFEQESFSIVLNTNRESVGVGILPRCSCIWERKPRLVHRYNNLESFLYNILLIENSVLGELIDEHYFLKKDLFPRFGVYNAVKIAATPLRRERNFKVKLSDRDKIQYFNIAYENPSFETDNELIWKKIWSAGENESDIVVFPELLGNAETADYVADKIKSLQPAEAQKIPSLIVLPSYWEKNRVMDKFGNVICRQNKQNPFRKEFDGVGYLEQINSNLVVNILHFEGIGRIAIMVCRDFLETEYMRQLMRCFKLTLIIVPSFSTGSYDFRRSFDLCAHEDCNVVWINTCAALIKGKEANFQDIGYVRKRISRNEDEAQMLYKMPICEGAFKGECAHDCIYYETIQGV